jgi:hypothetical protein
MANSFLAIFCMLPASAGSLIKSAGGLIPKLRRDYFRFLHPCIEQVLQSHASNFCEIY